MGRVVAVLITTAALSVGACDDGGDGGEEDSGVPICVSCCDCLCVGGDNYRINRDPAEDCLECATVCAGICERYADGGLESVEGCDETDDGGAPGGDGDADGE